MKHRSNLCKRIFTALALSVTMLVTAVPVSAGEIPESDDLSMLSDNNIPVVYITVDNSAHVQSGVKELFLNGTKLDGNYVPADKLADTNEIKVVLG